MFSHRILGVDTSELKKVLSLIGEGDVISFAGGVPNTKTFPLEKIKEAFLEITEDPEAFQYSTTFGFGKLRKELSKFLKETQGINVTPNEIAITHGSQQGMDIIGRVFVNPADTIIVEAPSYFVAFYTFQVYEPKFLQIPLDENGLNTFQLEKILRKLKSEGKGIKLLYTIPTFQNPTGVTMSEERRKHLVELADEFEFIIVEDNPYGDLRYSGSHVKAIKHYDKNGNVIYLGTFSKIFVPGFRLAWLVADKALMEKIEVGKQTIDICTNTVGQYVAWTFMKKGLLKKHIEDLIKFYRPKRDVMLDCLEEFMPGGVVWTRPEGGMFVWASVPEGIDTKEMIKEAVARGVAYVPGEAFFADRGVKNTLRLSFTFENEERIKEGVKKLAAVIREFS